MVLRNIKLNDRGVSEAIGFMLIFGMVIAGIGLVTLYGYPLLLQQQVGADEKIMEKNMIVLQNDIKSLAYKTVPFKSTSLKIGGGALTVYSSTTSPVVSNITIYDSSFPSNTYVFNFSSGELRYESVSAQTDISLQNGAVVMRPRINPGSVMLAEPRWFYDEPTNTMVINLINITSKQLMAKEGIGTVQMALVGEPYYNETIFTNSPFPDQRLPIKLDYTYDSGQSYSVAWDNYFTKTLNMPLISSSGTTKRYTLPINSTRPQGKLVIKKFEVEIKSI
jgi:ribosomal protein L33